MANHACIRDYLSWSEQLQALFCFPCRLFSTNDSLIKSSLASPRGWSANCGPKWKKLYDRLTEHENSASHQQCYLSWRDVQRSLTNEFAVDMMLDKSDSPEQRPLANDFEKTDTRSFLSVRKRSPFQRRLSRIGDKHNGLFLGVLEVIASYDSTLKGHLDKVRLSQEDNTRQQVHYLSPQSQNEFIKECSEKVLAKIKLEISDAKYYAMILDSTPDASHKDRPRSFCATSQPFLE